MIEPADVRLRLAIGRLIDARISLSKGLTSRTIAAISLTTDDLAAALDIIDSDTFRQLEGFHDANGMYFPAPAPRPTDEEDTR